MFKILKTTENNLTAITNVVEGAWVHVVNPTPEEFEKTYGLGIPQDFIAYPLDLNECPSIERSAGSTLILLRTPYAGKETDYATIPLGIVLCNGFIITITRYGIPLLNLDGKKTHYFSTDKRNPFILHLFAAVVNDYTSALRSINKKLALMNESRQVQECSENLNDLREQQLKINQLLTSLKANEQVFEKLQHTFFFKPLSDDAVLLDEIAAKNRHVIDMTSETENIVARKISD
jgi:magnesium transporter